MNPSWESTIEEVTEAMRNHVRPQLAQTNARRTMPNRR